MIDISDFQELLRFLDSFKGRDRRFYKKISTLSQTEETENRVLVPNCDEKLFSGDYFKKKCRDNTESEHSSVDGIYYIIQNEPFKLILIEFKFVSNKFLKKPDLEKRNIKLSLKLKPLETIFCVLPHLINKYGNDSDKELLNKQLNKSPKIYIFVSDFEFENPAKEHNYLNEDYFNLKRLYPIPFDEIHTLNVETFESFINDRVYPSS